MRTTGVEPAGYVPDCPVQPYVWREYSEIPAGEPLELITQLRTGRAQDPLLLSMLGFHFSQSELLVQGSYILIEATFEEMVTVLLPLTDWRTFLAHASLVTRTRLTAAIDAAIDNQPMPPLGRGRGLNSEDTARLRWLIAVSAGATHTQDRSELATTLTRLLNVAGDVARNSEGRPPVSAVGLNRPVQPAMETSRATVKADAAERLFDLDCTKVTWAVIDTGIDASHAAFRDHSARRGGGSRIIAAYDIPKGIKALRLKPAKAKNETRDWVSLDEDTWSEFADLADVMDKPPVRDIEGKRNDHGTHVAGILGADYRAPRQRAAAPAGDDLDSPKGDLLGMCPTIRLVDMRVFGEDGKASEFSVLVALAFIVWLNEKQKLGQHQIHGVNLSLSIPFEVDSHACGWTPVCAACDRLVRSGLVVVAAAGNAGFDEIQKHSLGAGFRMVSVSDPGNAERVITVGATHNEDPHRWGPTARSARGPTADGRHKPDLLAPGTNILGPTPGQSWARLGGTSQAAPHVSGAAAMLLARFPELRGQPERVKQILCDSATDLGRLPDFQGHGLLDALRALQYQ